MSQRVVFTFDEGSLESLRQIQNRGDFSSMGTAVRDSIQLSEILQDQVSEGFTEVVLRNPSTNQEKILIIPSLQKIAKTKAAAATRSS
jgi:hypothetical protein